MRSQPPTPKFDVVALREDPAVAARDDAELDHEPSAVALRVDDRVGTFALERDADRAVAAEAERLRA